MRRADRLFQIIQLLRRRRVVTAGWLATQLEVSERTIYRDVRDLLASGVPIESEAGVGYRLQHYDLPPLMFTPDEIEALVLGARIVATWTDPELGRAARSVISKVESVLPAERRHLVEATPLYAPSGHRREPVKIDFGALRRAIRERHKVRFGYQDAHGAATVRTVRPLALAFYGPVWILAAWCELRCDFRAFRPDRMVALTVLDEPVVDEPGRTIKDFLAAMTHEETAHGMR